MIIQTNDRNKEHVEDYLSPIIEIVEIEIEKGLEASLPVNTGGYESEEW